MVPGAGDGAERVEAVLPGMLVDWAAPLAPGGARSVMLLALEKDEHAEGKDQVTETESDPCSKEAATPSDRLRVLLQLDLSSGTLTTVADGIPAGCGRLLSEDRDADGTQDVLIACTGGLFYPDADTGKLVPLLEDPDMQARGVPGRLQGPARDTNGIVPVQMIGEARFYHREVTGSWTLLASPPLPISVSRREGELKLETASLRPVGRPASSRLLYAFGPEHHGGTRLRTVLLDPEAVGEAARQEVWSRLPRPEVPLSSTYALLDGHPALIVASRSAEKLSFFEEQSLRLFLLDEKDRSRTGTLPLLAAESHANLWQMMFPRVVDLDSDGRQDLVTAYWKGLKDTRLVLDAWMRRPDGTFRSSPATTEFDILEARRGVLSYGDDIDGDGLGDLAVHAAGELRIFRGTRPRPDGRRLVENRPRWAIAAEVAEADNDFDFGFSMFDEGSGHRVTAGPAPPAIVPIDLDGDGRLEIVIPGGGESGHFSVVRLGDR